VKSSNSIKKLRVAKYKIKTYMFICVCLSINNQIRYSIYNIFCPIYYSKIILCVEFSIGWAMIQIRSLYRYLFFEPLKNLKQEYFPLIITFKL